MIIKSNFVFSGLTCKFVPVTKFECPEDPDIKECDNDMRENELCEADKTLPDGNKNFSIDNCNDYDVFKCTGGKILS